MLQKLGFSVTLEDRLIGRFAKALISKPSFDVSEFIK